MEMEEVTVFKDKLNSILRDVRQAGIETRLGYKSAARVCLASAQVKLYSVHQEIAALLARKDQE